MADLTYLIGSCWHVAAPGSQSPTWCWDALLGVCCCLNSGPGKRAQQPAAVSHCVAERGVAVAFCPARSRPPVGFRPTLGCFQFVEWLAQTRSAQIAAARRQRPKRKMRMPGVEPGSQAWEACMMPLHYMHYETFGSQMYSSCSRQNLGWHWGNIVRRKNERCACRESNPGHKHGRLV